MNEYGGKCFLVEGCLTLEMQIKFAFAASSFKPMSMFEPVAQPCLRP